MIPRSVVAATPFPMLIRRRQLARPALGRTVAMAALLAGGCGTPAAVEQPAVPVAVAPVKPAVVVLPPQPKTPPATVPAVAVAAPARNEFHPFPIMVTTPDGRRTIRSAESLGMAPWGTYDHPPEPPATALAGVVDHGMDVIYVCDASASVGGQAGPVRRAVARSIESLDVGADGCQRFDVLFCSTDGVRGAASGLQLAMTKQKRAAAAFVNAQPACGGHAPLEFGLQEALACRPDVIYLVAGNVDPATAAAVREQARQSNVLRHTRIHCLSAGGGDDVGSAAVFKQVAAENGGTWHEWPQQEG